VATSGTRTIGMVWAQYSAYHIDRCEAVALRLAGRANVIAVEVATTSHDYAWEPSGAVAGAKKVTLFPGQSFDEIHWFARLRAMASALSPCDIVLIGLGYAAPDVILLSWFLRLRGKTVVVLSESKFDDRPRGIVSELAKAAALRCYSAAIVGGRRHHDYFRFLGFRRRSVMPGYDGVSLERVRQGGDVAPAGADWATRPFVYVGRFVGKKNLGTLLDAFAIYVGLADEGARPLILVGSGELEAGLRAQAGALGIDRLVQFTGFLPADAVSRQLSGALCLVLPSIEEQWGLVVNEALAFSLPVIVSSAVGSRDALVRNLENGFVVEPHAATSLATAMLTLARDRGTWERMVAASGRRAWLGDTERLADAVELLIDPAAGVARGRLDQFLSELELQSR
jgi:L-malate glycosyltransferase